MNSPALASLGTAAVLLSAAVSSPASFDCDKAATAMEKTICGSPALSALDDELARVYTASRPLVRDPAALQRMQRAWLEQERNVQEDPASIEAAYLARIEELRLQPELRQRLFAREAPPPSIFGRYSETEPLCLHTEDGGTDCDNNGEVESYIDVRPGSGHSVMVDIELFFFNGHQCALQGEAEWVGGVLRVPNQLEDTRCVLLIRFAAGKAITNDPAGWCRRWVCGMRGGFNRIELAKSAHGKTGRP